MEVRDEVAIRLARAERAHEDESADACALGGGHESLGPGFHDPLEVGPAALDDRDEVDDAVDAVGGRLEALRVGDVPLDELAAPRFERRGTLRRADEGANVVLARPQGVDDLRPDEPGAAGDENLHSASWKFRQ